jgi:hypothetical protein
MNGSLTLVALIIWRRMLLYFPLDVVVEKKIYVVDDFNLDIVGHSDIPCRHGHIVDVYHMHSHTENLFPVSQLTWTSKIVEFLLDCFFFKDLKNDRLIIIEGILNSKD